GAVFCITLTTDGMGRGRRPRSTRLPAPTAPYAGTATQVAARVGAQVAMGAQLFSVEPFDTGEQGVETA
ncbi:MAG: hypothetical protein LH477_02155, partial [Nocardioides sp.]|nr:hypothetical protein [Nocardioides sp.]